MDRTSASVEAYGKAAELFARLVENGRDVFWMRQGGRHTYVSSSVRDFYGIAPEDLYRDSRSLLQAVHPEDRAQVEAVMNTVIDPMELDFEYRVLRGGEVRWVRTRAFQAPPPADRSTVLGITEDITDRRVAETRKRQLLVERAARLEAERAAASVRAVLESITDGFFAVASDWTFTYMNRRAEEVLGRKRQDTLGKTFWETYPDALGTRFEREYRLVMERRAPRSFTEFYEPHRTWYQVSAYPSGTGISIFFRNVTEQKRLEREVLHAGEAERRRIGRDLHDGLGQELTGLGLMAQALERRLRTEGHAESAAAAKIVELVQSAIEQTRRLSRGLGPLDFFEGGLPAALLALTAEVEETAGIRCEAELPRSTQDFSIDENTATHLYRIAQEAANNAVRHAHAQAIKVILTIENGRVVLRIRDDGRGEARDAGETQGLGRRIMQHRAELIGATLQVGPGPSGGTEVSCTLPRTAAEEGR